MKDFLLACSSLRAGRVSENPRAISNLPHDVRTLNRCLTSKPLALGVISKHGFFSLIQFKNFDKASSNHTRRELHAWQRACSQWKHLLLYHALEICVQRTGHFLPLHAAISHISISILAIYLIQVDVTVKVK